MDPYFSRPPITPYPSIRSPTCLPDRGDTLRRDPEDRFFIRPPKFASTARLPAQNDAMGAHEYRDDDDGYRAWLKTHPGGYVINIQRSHSPVDSFLHDASCSALIAHLDRDVQLTGPYVKVCEVALPALEKWAADNVGGPVEPCGICRGGIGEPGIDQRICPTCRLYELSVSGKCPSCDDD